MAKQKEQVKYNPNISAVRRADRVKAAVNGRVLYVTSAVMLLMALIMMGSFLIGALVGDPEFIEDGETAIMFIANAAFMLFFFYVTNAVLPGNRKTEQNSKIDGCLFLYRLYEHLPVTKLTVVKMSFRYFAIMASAVCAILAAANVMTLCLDGMDAMRGEIGFVSVLLSVVMVALHRTGFSQYIRPLTNLDYSLSTGCIVVFYIIWFGSMMGVFGSLYTQGWVRALGGAAGLGIVLAAYAWVWVYEKCVIEKKSANSSWRDE